MVWWQHFYELLFGKTFHLQEHCYDRLAPKIKLLCKFLCASVAYDTILLQLPQCLLLVLLQHHAQLLQVFFILFCWLDCLHWVSLKVATFTWLGRWLWFAVLLLLLVVTVFLRFLLFSLVTLSYCQSCTMIRILFYLT